MKRFLHSILLSFGLIALCILKVNAQIYVQSFELTDDKVVINYSANPAEHCAIRILGVYANINGKSIEIKEIKGDLGNVKTAGSKKIIWDCFIELSNQTIEGEVFFEIKFDQYQLPSYGVRVWNMFLELNYTPSVPFNVGFGFGKRLGIYGRFGKVSDRATFSVGAYFKTLKWLTLNVGYNNLTYKPVSGHEQATLHGYEIGGTVLFFRSRWLGLNAGYIGTFQGGSEFHVGLTFNWNLK